MKKDLGDVSPKMIIEVIREKRLVQKGYRNFRKENNQGINLAEYQNLKVWYKDTVRRPEK